MKRNHPLTHFGKVASLVMFVALAVSMLGIPAASPVVAQEPTPTDDGGVTGQIVGGAPADPGEWPWQVALIQGSYVGTDYYVAQYCGGSLVGTQWVLTAAHCVVHLNGTEYTASEVDIVAGIYNLSSSAGSQRSDVNQIIIHPSYDNDTLENDIALLKLVTPVTIGGNGASTTAVVPLVPSSVGTLAGTSSWVTGWGDTESNVGYPEELYEVQVPIITNTLCAQSFPGAITNEMLCAGLAQGGKDSCFGDSGGPLVVSVNGQWQQAGIVSWGTAGDCALAGYYGVYTRVSSYVSWVEGYVKPDLAVTSIDIESPDVDLNPAIYANDDVYVYIEVQNHSGLPVGAFVVNVYVDGAPVACSNTNRDYYFNSTGLAGGAKTTLLLRIAAGELSVGAHSIAAYADSDCTYTEEFENNNSKTEPFTVNAVPVAAPVHDNVGNAKVITNLAYTDTVNVRGATRHASDPGNISCPAPDRILDPGLASVWYQYTPAADTSLFVDTLGSNYDTYIAVWEGTPGTTLVKCNDDSSSTLQSSLSVNLTSGTTYYFQVAQYSNDITNVMSAASLDGKSSNDVQAQAGGNLIFRVTEGVEIDVTIGTTLMGTYPMDSGESLVQGYNGTNGGPVVIKSTNGAKIIASLLQFRRPGTTGGWTGITQTMALTESQISDVIVLPRYDSADATKYNAVQFANFDSFPTNITVKIGGVERGTYAIGVGGSLGVTYPGVVGGPVEISSDNGAKIVASLYELKRAGTTGSWTGQNQVMGIPKSQLSDTYIIPRYNYTLQDLLPSLVFANASDQSTQVTVRIGGVLRGTYNMSSGQSRVESYSGVNGGPVVIESNNGANIIASLLQFRRPGTTGGWTGITQTMALTESQISDVIVLPHYDSADATKYNAVQFANFDSFPTNITVKIGGVERGTYAIGVGGSLGVTYPGVVGGPVEISSDNGAKIVASLYELKRAGTTGSWTGQTQMMGIPKSQLSDTYIIPRYNYTLQDLLPYLVFAVP